jgi:succinate dehydrogenase/fumarate reductase flavoprotein subunit
LFDRVPVDPRKEKLGLQPVAHTFDGGVKIDLKGQTSVPGLFAAGEVVGGHAGVSYPLSRCLTMGAIAGGNVVPFVKGSKSIQIKDAEWEASLSRIKGLVERKGKDDPGELKKRIGQVIYTAEGPVRDRASLEKGIKELDTLREEMNSVNVENPSQLKDALEAENSLVVGKALLSAVLHRKESRGPHFRSDVPQKDPRWFKRILISLDKVSGQLRFSEEAIQE